MTAVEVLRRQADLAFSELLGALEGVTEPQSWAVLPQASEEYLHTDGSVHGITLHIATGKIMYASMAFRNTEIRWRDLADRVATFEPSWPAALDYLTEAQQYWLSSWSDLRDEDLEKGVPHFRGDLRPAWRIIHTITHHDAWHGGQIPLIRYACTESNQPPPSVAEDIRQSCSDLPSW